MFLCLFLNAGHPGIGIRHEDHIRVEAPRQGRRDRQARPLSARPAATVWPHATSISEQAEESAGLSWTLISRMVRSCRNSGEYRESFSAPQGKIPFSAMKRWSRRTSTLKSLRQIVPAVRWPRQHHGLHRPSTRKVPEDSPDGTLLCTVPLLEGINHIVMSGRVVEVDEKRGVVLVMDFYDRALFCPEVHPAVPVRRVNDPHLPSCGIRSGPGA